MTRIVFEAELVAACHFSRRPPSHWKTMSSVSFIRPLVVKTLQFTRVAFNQYSLFLKFRLIYLINRRRATTSSLLFCFVVFFYQQNITTALSGRFFREPVDCSRRIVVSWT